MKQINWTNVVILAAIVIAWDFLIRLLWGAGLSASIVMIVGAGLIGVISPKLGIGIIR